MSLCLFSLASLVISEVGYWCLMLEAISTRTRKRKTLLSSNLARSARCAHITQHHIDLQRPPWSALSCKCLCSQPWALPWPPRPDHRGVLSPTWVLHSFPTLSSPCTVSSVFYLSAGSSLSLDTILNIIAAERTVPVPNSPGAPTLRPLSTTSPHVLLSPLCFPESPIQYSVCMANCVWLCPPLKCQFTKATDMSVLSLALSPGLRVTRGP